MSYQTKSDLYTYSAYVVKVYDGDTITVNIDLGFDMHMNDVVLRLHNLNTPELRGDEREDGLISRDWLREKILNKHILIKTIKDTKGKYGRYIAILYLNDENINESLIELGYAEYREY